MWDPFGTAEQKKGEETANQYDDVASAAEKKRPSLQIYKYIECTQQVMPFTYTSQHSRVRKVKKINQTWRINSKEESKLQEPQKRSDDRSTSLL